MKTMILLCGLLLLAACNGSAPTNGSGGPNEPNPNEQPR